MPTRSFASRFRWLPSIAPSAVARSPAPSRPAAAGRRNCTRATLKLVEPEHRRDLVHPPSGLVLRRPPHLQAVPEVLADGHVRVGHSSGTPSRRRGAEARDRSRPARRSRSNPPVTSSSPASARSSVDFPRPDGPTRAMNSPSATLSETPSRAMTSPGKTLVTFSKTISAMAKAIPIPHLDKSGSRPPAPYVNSTTCLLAARASTVLRTRTTAASMRSSRKREADPGGLRPT